MLVVPALVLPFGLAACSGDTPAGGPDQVTASDATEDFVRPGEADRFVGRWRIELIESGGSTYTGDALRAEGGDMTLEVRQDGTFVATASGEGAPDSNDGYWALAGGATAMFTSTDGSRINAQLDGDNLTLEGESYTFVFTRS